MSELTWLSHKISFREGEQESNKEIKQSNVDKKSKGTTNTGLSEPHSSCPVLAQFD